MEKDQFDPEFAARISSALVKAIAEAKALTDAGEFGAELTEIVRHARELHDLMREQMIAANPGTVGPLRGLCDAMGNNIGALESLVGIESHKRDLH